MIEKKILQTAKSKVIISDESNINNNSLQGKMDLYEGDNLTNLKVEQVHYHIQQSYQKHKFIKENQSFKVKRLTLTQQLLAVLINFIFYGICFAVPLAVLGYFAKPLYALLFLLPVVFMTADIIFFLFTQQFFAYAICNIGIVSKNTIDENKKIKNKILLWTMLIILFSLITAFIFTLVILYIKIISNNSFLERVTNTVKLTISRNV